MLPFEGMAPTGVAAALQAIESDDESDREQAIPILAASNRPEALLALERAAKQDDNLQLRFMAKEGAHRLRKALTGGASATGASRTVDLERLKSRLGDGDPARRLRGARSALAHRDPRALPILNKALAREVDSTVAAELCMTIGVLGKKGDGDTLLTKLQAKDAPVRKAAIKGLAYLKDPSVYPTVVAMLQDKDKEVRAQAFETLVRLGKPRLMKLLVRMLGSSRRWPRKAAIRACAKINSAEFVEVLVKARSSDPDPKLRREAVRALKHLAKRGQARATKVLEEAPPVELDQPAPSTEGLVIDRADQGAMASDTGDQIAALKAQVEAAQRQAAQAQAQAQAIAAQAQAQLQQVAAQAAASSPAAPQAAAPPAQPPAPPASPAMPGSSSASSSVSGTLPSPPMEFLDELDMTTEEESESLELSTAEVMVGGLHDPDPEVRMENLKEILSQKDRSLSQQLAARLPLEEDEKVLTKLLLAVGKLGRRKDARRVARFLRHGVARIRANAVEALAMLGDDASLEQVIPLLEDEDNRTRANAVVALKDHPSVNVLDTLKAMAKHPDMQMRLSAVFAALEIGTTDIDPVLHFLLKDKEQDVKDKAMTAMNLLEDQRMAPMHNADVDLESTQAHIAKLSAWRGELVDDDDEEGGGGASRSVDEEAAELLGKLSGDTNTPSQEAAEALAAVGGEAPEDESPKGKPNHWGRQPKRTTSTERPADGPSAWERFMNYLQGFENPGDKKKPGGGDVDGDRRKLVGVVVLSMVVTVLAVLALGGSGEDDYYVDETADF